MSGLNDAAKAETASVYGRSSPEWPRKLLQIAIEQAIARGVPDDRICLETGCTIGQYRAVMQAMHELVNE